MESELMLFPLADHGDLLMALPFAAPAILIAGALIAMVARERLRRRRPAWQDTVADDEDGLRGPTAPRGDGDV